MTAYHEEFRPRSFRNVVGNRSVIRSIEDVLQADTSHAFLFSGPAGTGKTTIARICATVKKCDVIEIDAATNSGVDNMREITELARFTMGNMGRAVIVDECHRLSGQAWDALLKITEEPGKNLFWFFCTTDPKKVPKTIQTRCTAYELQPLRHSELVQIVEDVIHDAKLDVSNDLVDMCVEHSGGSARQALVNLAKVERLTSKEAADVLIGAEASAEVIDLARFVMDGKGSWSSAMKIVADLKDQSPEGVRIVISNYLGKVLRNAKDDRDAMRLLGVLQHWVVPYATNEGITPLMVSIGRSLFTVKE